MANRTGRSTAGDGITELPPFCFSGRIDELGRTASYPVRDQVVVFYNITRYVISWRYISEGSSEITFWVYVNNTAMESIVLDNSEGLPMIWATNIVLTPNDLVSIEVMSGTPSWFSDVIISCWLGIPDMPAVGPMPM